MTEQSALKTLRDFSLAFDGLTRADVELAKAVLCLYDSLDKRLKDLESPPRK